MLISVILPAYNAAQYIQEAIRSVLVQTYRHLELIIVDDGSTDDTVPMCRQEAECDTRIVLIEQSNRGVSAARNTGLRAARGQGVVFVDSDDVLHPVALELMVGVMQDNPVEVVIASYTSDKAIADVWISQLHSPREMTVTLTGAAEIATDILYGRIKGAPWAKMFSQRCLTDVNFNAKIHYSEDVLFNVQVLQQATRCARIDTELYFYRLHQQSAVTAPLSRRRLTSREIYPALYSLARESRVLADLESAVKCHEFTALARLTALPRAPDANVEDELGSIMARLRELAPAVVRDPSVAVKWRILAAISMLSTSLLVRLMRMKR